LPIGEGDFDSCVIQRPFTAATTLSRLLRMVDWPRACSTNNLEVDRNWSAKFLRKFSNVGAHVIWVCIPDLHAIAHTPLEVLITMRGAAVWTFLATAR